ncbi:MAG TPA: hypothetical protein VLX68_16075 [Chitinivibrionales bacterium]|nr:hypothetical protein [Chitinivibrionales bacterium]
MAWSSFAQTVSFDNLTRATIASFTIPAGSIDGSDSSSNMIPTGTILVYKTNSGLLGKMEVVNYGYNLWLKIVTYNADGTVHAQADSVEIRGTFECSLDSAKETLAPSADFHWDIIGGNNRVLTMMNGATIGIYYEPNIVSFDNLTLSMDSSFIIPYSSLDGSDSVSNQIPTGTVLIYITKTGLYGKLQVLKYGYDLSLRIVTYNANGTVHAQADSVVIGGTTYCNLDSAKQSSSGGLFWHIHSAVWRSVDMVAPATIRIYYEPVSSLSNFVLAPPSPGVLANGQKVYANFNYTTVWSHGSLIWCLGMWQGKYVGASQGALPIDAGSDTMSRYIIAPTSGIGRIDSIQAIMKDSSQQDTFVNMFIPVSYVYGSDSVYNVQISPASPETLNFKDTMHITFSYFADTAVRIYVDPLYHGAVIGREWDKGSILFPAGIGSDSGRTMFGIADSQGVPVTVDSLRILMTKANGATIIKTFFIPVAYIFNGTTPVLNKSIQAVPARFDLRVASRSVSFALPKSARVLVRAYDVAGRCIATLADGMMPAGYFSRKLPSVNMLAFIRMEADGHVFTAKALCRK